MDIFLTFIKKMVLLKLLTRSIFKKLKVNSFFRLRLKPDLNNALVILIFFIFALIFKILARMRRLALKDGT